MGSSLAGLLILAVLIGSSLMIWRVTLDSNTQIGTAIKQSTDREGARARTDIDVTAAGGATATGLLTLSLQNDGSTSFAKSDFSKIDIIVTYDSFSRPPEKFTYAVTGPAAGEWTSSSLTGLFQLDVLNPGETLTLDAAFATGVKKAYIHVSMDVHLDVPCIASQVYVDQFVLHPLFPFIVSIEADGGLEVGITPDFPDLPGPRDQDLPGGLHGAVGLLLQSGQCYPRSRRHR